MSKHDYAINRSCFKDCTQLSVRNRRWIKSVIRTKDYRRAENRRFRHSCRHYVHALMSGENIQAPKHVRNLEVIAYFREIW